MTEDIAVEEREMKAPCAAFGFGLTSWLGLIMEMPVLQSHSI
jgi:hypothetical protein